MKIEIEGNFTSGYYNDMEAGYPVFIDGDSVSDKIKEKLSAMGLSTNFCDNDDCGLPGTLAENRLIGKRVKITIEINED